MLKTRGVLLKKKKRERKEKIISIMHSNVLNHGWIYNNIHFPI